MSEMKRMPKGTGTMQGVKEDTTATDKEIKMAKGIAFDKRNKDNMSKATSTIEKVKKGLSQQPDVADALKTANEDAGEGHMSKSQLYQTAKMAIELLDMINKGDDLEGWVQTKLNLAADYLQAVYHYEDYQKLNPYREELDANIIQRHAGIIQKHLDEILERKCRAEDVDTKPGMMRILKKRVNEVEKEIAKENRKQTDEAALDEGKLKDWAKGLAMAGIFVAGMACIAGTLLLIASLIDPTPAIPATNIPAMASPFAQSLSLPSSNAASSVCFLFSLAISFSTSLTLFLSILIMPGFVSTSSALHFLSRISSKCFCIIPACLCMMFASSSSLYGFSFW
jgi:hypothetical protein